jgi:hypothetical protein
VPVALAVDLDLAGAPVEIVEGERGHLPGAQPQACQQQQDGEVPPAMAGAPVAATQQARHLPGLYPPGARAGRRGATRGTAAASGTAVSPAMCRYRSSEPSAVTVLCADGAADRPHSATTNAVTSAAVSCSSAAMVALPARKRRATRR